MNKTPHPIKNQAIASWRQAERGVAILNRLVPAPDHGRGFRRDPETGFVYYSSEWLTDDEDDRWFSKPWNERDGDIPPSKAPK